MGVSGYFDRSADEAARRLGVGPRFRDTDPRPLPEAPPIEYRDRGLGLEALIPTEGRIGDSRRALEDEIIRSPIAQAEDERLIESLAAHLYAELDTFGGEGRIATAIREWRDGVRGRR